MSANINKIVMKANLTRDPECKQVGNTRLCVLGLATSNEFQGKPEVCFINANVWGGLTNLVEGILTKGMPLVVEGRLKLESWVAKDGSKKSRHTITVDNLDSLTQIDKEIGYIDNDPRDAKLSVIYDDDRLDFI